MSCPSPCLSLSPDYDIVLRKGFDLIFDTFEANIAKYYQQVNAQCIPLAKLLPLFVKETNLMHTSTYSQRIVEDPLLRMLNMSVYTSFDAYQAE